MNAHQRRVACRSRRGLAALIRLADWDYYTQRQNLLAKIIAEDMLPHGVWDDADGRLWAECCGCRRDREIEREHLESFDVRYFFCGGSPHCIP